MNKKVSLLDCTLRDGGYINDWNFGSDAINFILNKLNSTGIEFIEVGFIKPCKANQDRTVFPDVKSMRYLIESTRSSSVKYVGMVDMSNPISLDDIPDRTSSDIDAVRVIFKQDRIDEGYVYVKEIMKKGYLVMVQLVSTNTYSDLELIDVFQKFNELSPYAIYIVDSLGVIERKQFEKMVLIGDSNLSRSIVLGYHSHNNLQQAMGNASRMVEMNLDRSIMIDATIFGMGRGAGNLNMELFCKYLNENYGTNYRIEPMLEIIDAYLNDIYKENFWGYSLPYYLSAVNNCHPNYAKYFNEKGTLTEKAFDELLKTISEEDQPVYSKERAEKYYLDYMENHIDDKESIEKLTTKMNKNKVLLIAPGKSVAKDVEKIKEVINMDSPIVISVGFVPKIDVDYVFCSNLRKYSKISKHNGAKIITSNITSHDAKNEIVINYASYISRDSPVVDNQGVMVLNLMLSIMPSEILVAGFDGYRGGVYMDYYYDPSSYEGDVPKSNEVNEYMSSLIKKVRTIIPVTFITKSKYDN